MRRAVFDSVGGFSETLESGEDSEFCHRLSAEGLRLVSDPGIVVVHHDYPKDLRTLFKKEAWHSAELWNLLLSTRFRLEYLMAIGIPIIAGVFFAVGTVLLIRGFILLDPMLAASAVLVAFSVPIALAGYKAFQRRSFEYLPFSIPYFATVLLARLAAGIRFVVRAASSSQLRA